MNDTWHGLAIPLVLMVTGLVLLAGDGAGMLSLDRIQSFWPLSLIVIAALEWPSGRAAAPRSTND